MNTIYNIKYSEFARIGHHCELFSYEDTNEDKLSRYERIKIAIKRWLFMRITISSKRRCPEKSLTSMPAIAKERKRHYTKYPHMIHPFSDFRVWWQALICVNCLAVIISMPLSHLFSKYNYHRLVFHILRWFCDLLNCLDVILMFFTGFYSQGKGQVVMDMKDVFFRYIKTYFLMDLIGAIPSDMNLFGNGEADWSESFNVFNRLASLGKVFRFVNFMRYVSELSTILSIPSVTALLIKMIPTMVLLRHYCSFALVYFNEIFMHNIVAANDIRINASLYTCYSFFLYQGCIVTALAGAPAYVRTSHLEAAFTMLLWSISLALTVYYNASLFLLFRGHFSSKHGAIKLSNQLESYMKHLTIPRYTKRRVRSYEVYQFRRRYFAEPKILSAVSLHLREEIALHRCRSTVERVTFFKGLPTKQLVQIVSCLRSEVFLTNDVIIKANVVGRDMYFVESGTVAVYTHSGMEICHLEDGAHFGEVALFTTSNLRIASVIALEITKLFCLSRGDFIRALLPYPDLVDQIKRIAKDRLEMTYKLNRQSRTSSAGSGSDEQIIGSITDV